MRHRQQFYAFSLAMLGMALAGCAAKVHPAGTSGVVQRQDRPSAEAAGLEAVATNLDPDWRGTHVYAGEPRCVGSNCTFTTLERIGYAVGYSESRKDPLWSAYHIDGDDTAEFGNRPSRFKTDDETVAQVTHDDYKQSDYQSNPDAYDRGHMAPNHAIATRFGRDAQLETFKMSNICPQQKRLNQQTWAAMEKLVADWYAHDFEEVWVLVGPIFASSPDRLNGVAEIPEAFYMIVLDEDGNNLRALPIVMAQTVRGTAPVRDFITTVDDVEARTGLDFFRDLPNSLESALEAELPDGDWELDQLLVPTFH